MKIIKRDGTEVDFDVNKIINAVSKANAEVVDNKKLKDEEIKDIADTVSKQCVTDISVEAIQDLVEDELINSLHADVAKKYITYRYKHALLREETALDKKMLTIIDGENEEVKQENSNKNPTIISTQRDYMAGEESRELVSKYFMDKDLIEAHNAGIIHIHDTDYISQRIHNCCLINLEDMLQNGTVISGTAIESPKSFSTACNITTQIIAQVASSQYGGQSITLTHLAPFVDVSRKKIRKDVLKESESIGVAYTEDQIGKIVNSRLKREIKTGVQMIQYQIVTLMTTNGQAPFCSIFMYLNEAKNEQEKKDLAMVIEEMLLQRYEGVKNERGVWITPAFPKLLYVLEADNVYKGSEYYYLTELAAKCTAKRLVPDYISEKKMFELKEGNCYPCMGCRSFLTVWKNKENKYQFYGRFNQGVCTINLVDVACSSEKDFDKFWKIFDDRLELCHRVLLRRHERLLGTKSDVAPIMWQYGALARLKKGEVIDELLNNGYSTISLGYAGLYECVKYMTGESHTGGGKEFALKVMQKLNDACAKWKEESGGIGFSVYGTPLESTTYKFAKCLKKRFGEIKDVTDHDYITNSYHVNVREQIDAFTKLSFESAFQDLSPGGAISYVEVPDMKNNISAVISVIQYIYENIMYAELNTKSDYCQVCGYDGEIAIEEQDGKLIWKCPQCGNTDQNKMNVARRTCGLTYSSR